MKESTYWSIEISNGIPALYRDCTVNGENHSDFIEMSGLYASFIVKYGIENGKVVFNRHPVFPMLRTFPNDTKGSYQLDIDKDSVPEILANGKPISESVCCFRLNGTVECNSVYNENNCNLEIKHIFFPSVDKQAVCEMVTLYNRGTDSLTISLSENTNHKIDGVVGPMGAISAMIHVKIVTNGLPMENDSVILRPDGKVIVSIIYSGKLAMQKTRQAIWISKRNM